MSTPGRASAPSAVHIAAPALAWLAGIGLQMQQPRLWPVSWYVTGLLVALALGLAGWLWRRGGRLVATLGLCLALALAAFASTGWRAAQRLAEALPAVLEGRDLQLEGVVAQMPQPGPQGTRFVFDVDQAWLDGQPVAVPRKVSLGWYGAFEGEALGAAPPPDLRAGQRWRLSVRLRAPHGTLNPHGFDLELWLFEQGIRASGSVRAVPGSANRLMAENAGRPIERARQSVRDAILLRVADARAAGVLAALAVGDQAAIERDDWELFRITGVAHLMSISGLHVTMFAWLAAALVAVLWRLSPQLMLACPTPLAARWGGVLAAAGYALFAGWGVPAQRTLWMLAALALLRSLGLRWPLPLVLLAAAWVVTLIDPWAVMQPGLWLSFAAVALLMASEPAGGRVMPAGASRARRALAALRGGLHTQAVASIGLAPLSLVFFQQVSVVGLAANLLAIPLVTLAIVPLSLLGVAVPPLWNAAGGLVQTLSAVLGWMAGWPFAQWTAAAAPAWAAVAGLLGGALLVMPLPWRLRLLGLPLLLPLLAPPVQRPADGAFEFVAADIGQGNAVLVRTRTHLLVYDAGPRYSAEADAAQRVLLPLLRARGERHIDLLMLSHRDTDHVGGAATLLQQMPARAISSSLSDGHPLLTMGVPNRRCEAGQRWQWDGVDFELLHPQPGDYKAGAPPNALSCVLRVQAADGSTLLLAGDIEAAQEAALVARVGPALRSQWLLVPHHGSRTSSTEAFVGAVAPGTALVQAGYRNRFGHPAPDVQARYRAFGVELVRSDACGAFSLDARGASRCEREAGRRYWHHRPDSGAEP